MLILNEMNQSVRVDAIQDSRFYFSVLSLRDYKNPDFMFQQEGMLEEFVSPVFEIKIGQFRTYIPFHWSILCSDHEYVQLLPLREITYGNINAWCMNPIDGYAPFYLGIEFLEIHPNMTWLCPPLPERDLLVMPLGNVDRTDAAPRGPLCTIITPHSLDLTRPVSDLL